MSMRRSLGLTVRISAILLILALAAPTGVLHANGAPVEIPLYYFPNISNWGPTGASGTAMVGLGEGSVGVEVQGLPYLPAGLYQIWIVAAEDGAMYEIGKFSTDAKGDGHFRTTVSEEDLPYRDYQLVLITVEEEPDPSPNPDERWSLVGFFAKYRPPTPTPAPTPTPTPVPTPTRQRPKFIWGTPTVTSTPTVASGTQGTPQLTATQTAQVGSASPTPSPTPGEGSGPSQHLPVTGAPQHLPTTGAPVAIPPLGMLVAALAVLAFLERRIST